MNRLRSERIWVLALAMPLLAACDAPPRPVDADPSSGFALYRSGLLSHAEIRELCALGVEEILVLDGEAEQQECRLRSEECPGLRVRYNLAQEEDTPVAADFLRAFDAWIDEARSEGRKVAFRCRHGWHRTGRLAAYYRLRFGGASAEEATGEMHEIGRLMFRHPTLGPQVAAYADFVAGRACSTDPARCVSSEPDPGVPSGRFPADVCGSGPAAPADDGVAAWLVRHQRELGVEQGVGDRLPLRPRRRRRHGGLPGDPRPGPADAAAPAPIPGPGAGGRVVGFRVSQRQTAPSGLRLSFFSPLRFGDKQTVVNEVVETEGGGLREITVARSRQLRKRPGRDQSWRKQFLVTSQSGLSLVPLRGHFQLEGVDEPPLPAARGTAVNMVSGFRDDHADVARVLRANAGRPGAVRRFRRALCGPWSGRSPSWRWCRSRRPGRSRSG